jgi:hypothetical protein
LPGCGGRLLRVEKERQTEKDTVFHPPQVQSSLRVRRHLVPQAWRQGDSLGPVRYRHLPAERTHGRDPQPDARNLATRCNRWLVI